MPSVDALTLAALAGELRAELSARELTTSFSRRRTAVALQCYGSGRNRWLLASAHPQLARIHLIERKPRKLVTEPPAFVMLLRKHLEGARIVALASRAGSVSSRLALAVVPARRRASPRSGWSSKSWADSAT